MSSVPYSDSFPLNPPYDPFIIRYMPSSDPAINFNGQPPLAGPNRLIDNTIAQYQGQANNGFFLFSKVRYYQVRQMVVDPGDATDWELTLKHAFLSGRAQETSVITNQSAVGTGLQLVELNFSLFPGDALQLVTSGVTSVSPFVEVYAEPITLDRRIR